MTVLGNKMKIFYLHGFGVKESLSKPNQLKKMYPDADVIAVNYEPHDPVNAQARILDAIDTHTTIYDDVLFVGTSLGGFWARWASCMNNNVQAILINPQLQPEKLKPGLYTYYDTGGPFEVTQSMIDAFKYFNLDTPSVYTVAIAEDDEVIDVEWLKDFLVDRSYEIYPGQGHRFENINILKEQIDMFLNLYFI